MNTREKKSTGASPAIKKVTAPSLQGLYASMARYGVVFDADPAPGVTGDPPSDPVGDLLKNKKPDSKPEPKSEPAEPKGPSEEEKALRKALKEAEARAKSFGDATPEEVAELRKLKAEAEKAKADVAAAKAKAEEEKLQKAGDFEALKQRMKEEHEAASLKQREEAAALAKRVEELNATLIEANIGQAFQGSKFLAEETVLSAAKARKVYGDHFDYENGKVVAYDAPRGAAKRTPYVDARGEPLAFDEAMKRIVEADADRDTVLRAKTKPGAQVSPSGLRAPAEQRVEPTGLARIRVSIGNLLQQT